MEGWRVGGGLDGGFVVFVGCVYVANIIQYLQ